MAETSRIVVQELDIAVWGFGLGIAEVVIPCVLLSLNSAIWCVVFATVIGTVVLVQNRNIKHAPFILAAALFLGVTFSVGFCFASYFNDLRYFGFYVMILSFFHWSEYITTALFNSHTLSMDSFLLNHSMAYGIAAVASWLEYFVELYLFPQLKQIHWLSCIGIIIAVVGEAIRKRSMFVARSNFTHVVATVRSSSHRLITHDIYSLWRHPSYVGWFWWSIGTQMILCNPICFIGYVCASWSFFNERIHHEEKHLLRFFGQQYVEYMRKVNIGIPFIHGYNKIIKRS